MSGREGATGFPLLDLAHLGCGIEDDRDRWAAWALRNVLLGFIIATLGQGFMNG